jgi:hypothetical protein
MAAFCRKPLRKNRIPNAAGATGRVARPVKYGNDNGKPWRRHYFTGRGARGWAMTEIRFEPAHFGLKFFEQPRNQATKPDNFVPSLLCCSTTPHSPFRT